MKRFGFIVRYLWVLGLVWLGGMTLLRTPRETRVSTDENRMLAAAPALSAQKILDGSFMTETEEWLSDGVALRGTLIGMSRSVESLIAVPKNEEDETAALIEAIEAEMNAGPNQAAEPVPKTSPTETFHPTEYPTPTAKPVETPEPCPSPIAEATGTPLPGTTPEPTEAPTPAPTELPIIGDASFRIEYGDGTQQTVFDFPAKNIYHAADVLNAYRDALPPDGNVVFLQVPVASMGNTYLDRLSRNPVWRSDLEEKLESLTKDGVIVVKAEEAMNAPLQNGEYVYFRTDHHWTARGAYYAYRAAMERLGIPPADYGDYTYSVRNGMRGNNAKSGVKSDTLEVMHELLPTQSYIVSHLDKSKEIPFMDYSANNYLAFLGGTKTPWRRFETGSRTGRTALLIGDSFSNAFLPYLLLHYDRVMMTDLRFTSYRHEEAGASVSEYIEAYGVDDVYFVLCLATSINSEFFIGGQVVRYLH